MITPKQALDAQVNIFARSIEIIKAKRVDYSGDADPFANFRLSQFWGVEPWKGAAIRMMDKLSRLRQLFAKNGEGMVKDESIQDTIVDAINYLVIILLLWLEAAGRDDVIKKLAGEE